MLFISFAGCGPGLESRPYVAPLRPGPADWPSVDAPPIAPGDVEALQVPEAADEPMALSIEQAVLLALQNNRGLRVRMLQPQIVGTFEQRERAIYDPRVRGGVAVTQARRPQFDPVAGEAVNVDVQQQSAEVGLRQRITTGTEVGVDLSHTRTDTDMADEQHVPRVGVTLSQALLQGRSREANLASIRQAELATLASEYELRGFAESLAADVERTFWSYALARREIEIFESSVALAEQQLRDVERRVEVGALAPTELAAGRAELARRREDLINAQAALDQIRLRLLRLMQPGAVRGWDRRLDPVVEVALPVVEMDPVQEHLAVAREMRPELNEARLRLEQGRLDVIRTRDGLLPRLDLFLTLGKTGYADAFGQAYRELFDSSTYDLSVGLQFEHPLGNRAARADHRRARLSREQLAESLENLAELIELDVRSAYVEIQRALEQVTATRATRELREETLRVEQARFQVGTSTAFIVSQAQRDLLESQISEVRAVVNYRQALVELYRLEGSLLLRRALDAPGVAGEPQPAPMVQ